jgi:hypothetical protein
MTNTSSPVDTPADSAPAEALVTPVEGQGNADARKRSKNKVVLAREPSNLDPTRYGDWE